MESVLDVALFVVVYPTVCGLYGSQNKQQLLPYTELTKGFCITEVESVYYAVRTESLYEIDTFSFSRVQIICPPRIQHYFHSTISIINCA